MSESEPKIKQKSTKQKMDYLAFRRKIEVDMDQQTFCFSATRKEIFDLQFALETSKDSFEAFHNFLMDAVNETQETDLLEILTDPENMGIHMRLIGILLPAFNQVGVSLGKAKPKVSL